MDEMSVLLQDEAPVIEVTIYGTGPMGPQGPGGPAGPQGEQGEQGIQGETGPAGADGAAGQDGADGADGADGVSPEVTIAEITGGHSVTITDADHPTGQTFNVMDGADGQDGAPGQDGADGQDGTDGVSPEVTIATITGGHRVTITDADHPTGQSFDVMDGSGASITVDSSLSDSSTNPVQNKVIKSALDAKGTYSKPSGGIPSTDLASAVQTSLGKADAAYQKPSGGIPKTDMSEAVGISLGLADSAYQKPAGGIPAADLASGVIPTVPSEATATPSNLGTAAVGSSSKYAKEDHVHAMPTAANVGAAPAVTEVTVSTAGAVTQALDAGKIYHFTGALTALTITLNAASGQPAQYHFDFTMPSTAFTPTLTGVTMPSGNSWEASKRYEVDILNGYGVSMAW